MGCQLAVCVPDKDIIMVYNGDNQGNKNAKKIIIDNFYKSIVRKAVDKEIPECDFEELKEYAKNLELYAVKGEKTTRCADKINGVTYKLSDNPMGISEIRIDLREEKGVFHYVNAQGKKDIPFGLCKNEFSLFPQEGYSDMIGTMQGNKLYKCAASAGWISDDRLFIKVQIIDNYFGILNITLGFKEDKIGVFMTKAAEDFLKEYEGYAGGKRL